MAGAPFAQEAIPNIPGKTVIGLATQMGVASVIVMKGAAGAGWRDGLFQTDAGFRSAAMSRNETTSPIPI
jgi:hypothetical protein